MFHSYLDFLIPLFRGVHKQHYIKSAAQKAQRSFQSVKAQRQIRNLFFLTSEAQRNFRNGFFDLVEAQRNSANAERHFRTKLKRNLTSAIEISRHNANTAFFCNFRQEKSK